jgi:hypothetical protein
MSVLTWRQHAMQPLLWIVATVSAIVIGAPLSSRAEAPQARQAEAMGPHKFKAAAENTTFEWFFLLVYAGNAQGIWARHGLAPEFVPAAGSSDQLRERVDAGIGIGFVNAAEVTMARSAGVRVKTVAAYSGKPPHGSSYPGTG